MDLADLFEKGMIGERAFGGAVIAHLRAISPQQRMNFLNPAGNRVAQRTVEDYFEQFVAMPLWAANSEIDELFYLQLSQSNLDAFRQLRSGAPWPVVSQLLYTNIHGMEAAFTNPLTRHRYFVSVCLMPNIIRAANACIQNETQRRLTITAIALERQRLRNGKFPTDLKALVPQFLSAVPMDLMGGKPLRYRLNANGDFTLYSVGENGRDDGGDPNPSSHAAAMSVCPISRSVNPAFKIRIQDLKGTSQPIRPPRERPPPNPNGVTHLLAQVALDPLPAQNHCQEYKYRDDAWNEREIAQRDEILGGHATWPAHDGV